MSGGGKGGGGDFWPGFVDALTNVVIAMVFVIVVLAIALSFSAQMLAKRMAAKIAEQQAELGKARQVVIAPAADAERLQAGAPLVDTKAPQRTRIAVAGNEAALAASAASAKLKPAEQYLQLDFAPGALTIDAAAAKALGEALAPLKQRLTESPTLRLEVVAIGPEIHLSENQRAAFIRAMAVRNELLGQGIAGDRIVTRIDMNAGAPQAAVAVRLGDKP
jgi:cell division protein FtsB